MTVEKRQLSDLAIYGGPKAFSEALLIDRPNIGDMKRLRARVDQVFQRRLRGQDSPNVREFEAQIARFIGVKHCLAVRNVTFGLEIALRALGVSGEVIMPLLAFEATSHALHQLGIRPVFCDVDPMTHNLNVERVEAAVTPATTGILGIHLWGRPCAVDALADIARRHHLKLLFDATQAFACSHQGEMIGNFGSAEVFSFHATTFCNSLDGGAIVTNDDGVARRARIMRNFGFVDLAQGKNVGANSKMNEISAAVGLTSLESVAAFIHTNQENYRLYQHELAGIPGISLIRYDETACHNYQYIVLDVEESLTAVSRDQLVQILAAENVITRRPFYSGDHQKAPDSTDHPNAKMWLPETERLGQRLICLPTGTAVSPGAIRQICAIIRLVVAQGLPGNIPSQPLSADTVSPLFFQPSPLGAVVNSQTNGQWPIAH